VAFLASIQRQLVKRVGEHFRNQSQFRELPLPQDLLTSATRFIIRHGLVMNMLLRRYWLRAREEDGNSSKSLLGMWTKCFAYSSYVILQNTATRVKLISTALNCSLQAMWRLWHLFLALENVFLLRRPLLRLGRRLRRSERSKEKSGKWQGISLLNLSSGET